MKRLLFPLRVILISFLPISATQYHVSTGGSDSNNGTVSQPVATITKGIELANPGDTIYVHAGTYNVNTSIRITKSGTAGSRICLFSVPGEARPAIDASTCNVKGTPALRMSSASYWHVRGFEIRNAPDPGLYLDGASSNNILEYLDIHHNGRLADGQDAGGKGLFIWGTSANNLVRNCDSHHNVDLARGNADGFAVFSSGAGNRFIGNRAFRNSDDGFDFFRATSPIYLDSNWVFENGYDDNLNALGDGNGFKLGGDRALISGGHTLVRNLAWHNKMGGFDENSAARPCTLYNNTSWNNPSFSYGFWEQPHLFKNNIAFGGQIAISGTAEYNSWNLSVTVTTDDFQSMDDTHARAARGPDGALPVTNFLHLATGSDLINKGTNVGLTYSESAPDLGAYEHDTNPPRIYPFRRLGTFAGSINMPINQSSTVMLMATLGKKSSQNNRAFRDVLGRTLIGNAFDGETQSGTWKNAYMANGIYFIQ